MTPRERRLRADHAELTALAGERGWHISGLGDPPETYRIAIQAPGIALKDGLPYLLNAHRFSLYLHTDYPRRPPVVQWLTPMFHPNILPPERHGAACIGAWSPSETLADLVCRLVDLATYRSFNVDDALNPEAAAWTRTVGLRPGESLERAVADA